MKEEGIVSKLRDSRILIFIQTKTATQMSRCPSLEPTFIIMIKLIIKFSLEYEIERIKATLEKLQWYKNQGYNPKFPESLTANLGANISEDQIKESVETEYNEGDFKIQETYLLENWNKIVTGASAEFTKASLSPKDAYIIRLTKYGVSGSYHYPDSVIVNIKSKYEKGLLRTVFHEILHLMIHLWIIEYRVSHWQKERIVDLLMLKFVPQISKTQQIPIEITKLVDQVFNEHYPNVELIIKNVGLLQQS